jgi:hypothetical protein
MWNSVATTEDRQVHHGAAVLQIGTPSCTTWFLMVPSIIPQSATLQHLLLECSSNESSKKRWKQAHHGWRMAPRTDTNQHCRHVSHDMAKGIQISRVMSANTIHSTKILAVNHKQLSSDIILDPLFLWYLRVSSVKTEPQWEKYPNLSVRSFMTSKKWILGFYFIAKTVHIYNMSPFH